MTTPVASLPDAEPLGSLPLRWSNANSVAKVPDPVLWDRAADNKWAVECVMPRDYQEPVGHDVKVIAHFWFSVSFGNARVGTTKSRMAIFRWAAAEPTPIVKSGTFD